MKKNKKNKPDKMKMTFEAPGKAEFEGVARYSRLRQFLAPTSQKRIYLLLLAVFLGIAFSFATISSLPGPESLPWFSFWALMILSFPSFLLWQSYGKEPLSESGIPFAIFSILMQFIWLYLIACSLSLAIKWKKVEK